MFSRGRQLRAFFAGCVPLAVLFAGTVISAVPASSALQQQLRQADDIKSSNNAEFVKLIQQLGKSAQNMAPEQRLYLEFLVGWQAGYSGNYIAATRQLDQVIDKSISATLRFRAEASVVNMLEISSHYEEAYVRLGHMLDQLPLVTDKVARTQGMGVVSILYNQAGQYDLASFYADQVIKEATDDESICKGNYLKLQSLYQSGKLHAIGEQFQDGIQSCVNTNEPVFANFIRYFVADFEIKHGQSTTAIELLQKNYATVERTHYPVLISYFDASLAQGYWNTGAIALAKQFAQAAT